jgi:hypothetical protein
MDLTSIRDIEEKQRILQRFATATIDIFGKLSLKVWEVNNIGVIIEIIANDLQLWNIDPAEMSQYKK